MRTVLFAVVRYAVRSNLAASDGPQHSQHGCGNTAVYKRAAVGTAWPLLG